MIYPKCKDINPRKPGNSIAVRSCGHVVPCCFFGNQQSFDEIAELLGDDIKNIHLKSGRTLDEINKSAEFQRIEETWNTDTPLKTCVHVCSNPIHIAEDDRHSTGSKFIRQNVTRKK